MALPARALILETSHRLARVALAQGERVIAERVLTEPRRHASELAPALKELLAEQAWAPRSVEAIFVSRGPGSYTGLRVGIMSAKTFAYATGAAVLAVDTFAALAHQVAAPACVEVIADAQQDRLYTQRFRPDSPLTIQPFASWLAALPAAAVVVGPGLEQFGARLGPTVSVADPACWLPQAQSLLEVGLQRWQRGERDDPFAVEPLYLRPSAAEEQWQKLGRA